MFCVQATPCKCSMKGRGDQPIAYGSGSSLWSPSEIVNVVTFISLLVSFRNLQAITLLIDNLSIFNCGKTLGGSCGTQTSHSLTSLCFRYKLSVKFTQRTGKQVEDRLWLAIETKDPKCVKTIRSLQAKD